MASLGPIWEYRRIVLPSTVDDGGDALSNNMKVAICRFPLGQYRPSPVQTSRIEKVILLQVLLSLSYSHRLVQAVLSKPNMTSQNHNDYFQLQEIE